MTITITERPGSANWSEDERSYTREFYARTSSPTIGPGAVLQATGIQRYDSYISAGGTESDGLALCRSITATPLNVNGQDWQIVAEYGKTDRAEPEEDNPLDRPLQYSGGFAKFQKLLEEDAETGEPLVNSAFIPFNPVPEIDASRQTFSITRNEPVMPEGTAQYIDKLNADTFYGAEPGTVKVSNITFNGPVYENTYEYWPVTYEFEHRAEGYKVRVLDAGLKQLKYSESDEIEGWEDILDEDDNPVTEPVALKSDGTAIMPDEYDDYVEANGAPILEFDGYTSINFSGFGLE